MRQYFNTKEAAQRSLEKRRAAAYKKFEKLGWKVLGDSSFVSPNYKWTKPRKMKNCDLYYSEETKELKWYVNMMIVTDEMIKDLKAMKPIDAEAELEALLKEIPDEVNKIYFDSLKNEKNT